MRELEFLPDWYRNVCRRRAWVIAQAWGTAGLVVVMVIWACIAQFQAMRAQHEQKRVAAQVTRSQKDVDELRLLQLEKNTWNERGEVMAKVGLSVESTRLLQTIADSLPETVALTSFNLQTDEKIEVPRSGAAARAMKDKTPTMDRKLRVRLTGISRSDSEVWDLVTELTKYSFFEDVQPNTKEGDYEGRLVKEFEITFTIDLNAPPAANKS
jgi:Tfp pilus assembly protein PilN